MNSRIRWRLPLALICLACFAPAAAAQSAPAVKVATVEGITEYKLDNGLRFLLYPDPSSSTVTVNMTVLVGSRHEGYGETGMAHLLEHMCFKGTPKNPNIDKVLQEHGANKTANGTTYLDRTNYFERMPASDANLEFGIMLKADILVNSLIKKEDLEKEWTVVRSEFERNENNPVSILLQRTIAAAFEWHNYGKTTMGNRYDLEKVPIESLRAFYRKYYQPDNVVFTIAGKFDEKKAIEYVEKYFGSLKRPTRVLEDTYTVEPAQDGERNVVLRRVGNVPVVGIVYHVPGTSHEDFAALDVLTTVLTSEPTGRLYKALVEKKKASSVNAGVETTRDPYLVEIVAEVAPKVTPEEVREAIIDVVEKLGKVNDDEVEKAKRKMLSDRERSLTKSEDVTMSELSEWIGSGDWRLLFIHRDRVAKVTAKDVADVAAKYFKPSNRTVGIYLPSKESDRTTVPENPNIAKLVTDYKGSKVIAEGEKFDPTPENLEKRTKRFALPTGMKVALLPKKTRGEMVVGHINLRYGSEKSLFGKTTVSDFLGPLMMRGTSKHTFEQIQVMLDELGAALSGGGSSGDLSFSLECKREKLPAVLDLLGEILRSPVFPEDQLEILKRESRQGIEKGLTDPIALAREALSRQLDPWPKDSIHYVPTMKESMELIDKVTRADVVGLYNEQIGATAGEIVFVGDFDEPPTMKLVQAMLDGWQAKTKYERIPSVVKSGVPGGTRKIETPDKENAVYVAGFNFALDDMNPEFPALIIGNAVLGNSAFNSRIVDRLRTKEGLSYGAGSRFFAAQLDKVAGFRLSAICNPKNMPKVDSLMTEILGEFVKKGVTPVEVTETAKGWLEDRKVDRSSDSSVARTLAAQLFLGRTYERTIKLEKTVSELTADQVNAAIRRYLDPSRFYIVEAGDFAKKQ